MRTSTTLAVGLLFMGALFLPGRPGGAWAGSTNSHAPLADVVLRDPHRVITANADGSYSLDIEFTPGADADDGTIVAYVFRYSGRHA